MRCIVARLTKQTLDGNMETLILSVLAGSPGGQSYGYRIVQDLGALGEGVLHLGEGTVYPVLHRLEKRELIAATWHTADNGRNRKYYRLTPKGRRALKDNRAQWEGLARVMQAALGPLPAAT